MGNELSTSAAQQDWSEEQVAAQMKALFDFDGYLASPSPSPGAPSSDLCVDTPENASRPSDGFHPPGEMSPAFCCCPLPMLPAQHPPAAAPTSIAPAPDTQATSVSVPPPMGLKMPPLDVSSPHHMQLPGPPAQAPTLSAYTISFQTPILQDEHTHVPGMAPELTPLGTKALARESLVDRSHDVLKASGAPGFIAGRPMYQPMSNVGQVSWYFVSTPSAKVCLTHRALCLCRNTPTNASTLRNGVCGCRRARSCATSLQSFAGWVCSGRWQAAYFMVVPVASTLRS